MNAHIVKPMARGQITIPQQFRDELGITADTHLWIMKLPNKGILIKKVEDPIGKEDRHMQGLQQQIESLPSFKEWLDEPDLYSDVEGEPFS